MRQYSLVQLFEVHKGSRRSKVILMLTCNLISHKLCLIILHFKMTTSYFVNMSLLDGVEMFFGLVQPHNCYGDVIFQHLFGRCLVRIGQKGHHESLKSFLRLHFFTLKFFQDWSAKYTALISWPYSAQSTIIYFVLCQCLRFF